MPPLRTGTARMLSAIVNAKWAAARRLNVRRFGACGNLQKQYRYRLWFAPQHTRTCKNQMLCSRSLRSGGYPPAIDQLIDARNFSISSSYGVYGDSVPVFATAALARSANLTVCIMFF